MHSDICRIMANPKRLMIIDMLGLKEMSVGEIAAAINAPTPQVSQHLRLLRDKNLVKTRKDGQTVYYVLVEPKMIEACSIIRSILIQSMKKQGVIAENFDMNDLFDETDEITA